jgi:hypothetical protein
MKELDLALCFCKQVLGVNVTDCKNAALFVVHNNVLDYQLHLGLHCLAFFFKLDDFFLLWAEKVERVLQYLL